MKADDETGLVKVTAAFQKFKSRDLATLIYDFRPAADRHLDGHRNDRANVKFRAILEKYQKLSDSIPKEVLELIEAVDPISFVPVTVLSNDVQIEIPSKLVNSTPVMVSNENAHQIRCLLQVSSLGCCGYGIQQRNK